MAKSLEEVIFLKCSVKSPVLGLTDAACILMSNSLSQRTSPSRSSHSGHRQPPGARLLDLAQNSRNRSLDGCVKFRTTFSRRQFVLHRGVPAKFLNRCIQFGSILKNKLLLLLLLR